jgi:flagella basal body P-ring formation protein FlgA
MLRKLLLAASLLLARDLAAAESGAAAARQLVTGATVAEAARQHLLDRLAPAYASIEVTPVALPSDVTVAAGAVRLQVRELAGQALRPRMVLWVDVQGGGAPSRPVPVALAVRAMRQVLVARRALAAGELVDSAAFEAQLRDVAAMPLAAAALLEGAQLRLRKALNAGDMLLQADQASVTGVLRGDHVTLRSVRAGLVLESRAQALADGEPGQRIAVRPVQGEAAVRAMVAGPGLVRLED